MEPYEVVHLPNGNRARHKLLLRERDVLKTTTKYVVPIQEFWKHKNDVFTYVNVDFARVRKGDERGSWPTVGTIEQYSEDGLAIPTKGLLESMQTNRV